MNINKFFARIAAAIACAGFLSACMTSDDESGSREIRVDAFSHFWETSKARGRAVGSTRIIVTRDSAGPGEMLVDTLRLLDPSQNKTASLPAHTIGRFGTGEDSSKLHLFYAAESEPRDFSCYLQSTGKTIQRTDDPDTDDAFFATTSVTVWEGEVVEPVTDWLYFESTTRTISRIFDCGYSPGKGFYFGIFGIDRYAEDPSYAGSEIVIRY